MTTTMCVRTLRILLSYIIPLLILMNPPVICHVPTSEPSITPSIERFCKLSESCFHDTIPICGQMGNKKKTFLDICDMLEYACDTNQIYTHVDDEECPLKSEVKQG